MAIIKCPECGHQISEKASNCPSCGVEIAGKVVRCEHCGEVYFNDEVLCPNCHAPQSPSSSSPSSSPSPSHKKNAKEKTITPVVSTAEEMVSAKTTDKEETKEAVVLHESKEDYHEKDDVTGKEDKSDTTEERQEIEATQIEDEQDDEVIDESTRPTKSRIMPFFVSLAIASIVGAVSIYFYKESKGSKEQQAYGLALNSNDTLSMNNFLLSYSDAPSVHIDSIRARLDYIRQGERDWDSLQAHKTHENAVAYVARYPNMSHYTEAVELLDSIDWADVMKDNTSESFQRYLANHQEGKHAAEARERVYAGNLDVVASEERQIVTSLMQRFFQSVNDNDANQFKSCLSSSLLSFMGTEHPSTDEAASWMRRQHSESVKSVAWSSSGDYEISKRKKDNGSLEYAVKFTAKQDMIKGGKSSSDRYKVNATITTEGKMTSLGMVKIVPQEEGKATTSSSTSETNKPKSTSSSPSTSKPKTDTPSSSSASKPKTSTSSSSSTQKPKTSTSSSSSTSKPKTSTSSSSSTTKPKTSTSSSSSTSKPKTSTSSSSSTSKPKTSTSSSSSTSKPKTSTSSSSSTSKPKTGTSSSSSTSKPKTGSSSSSSTSKPKTSTSSSSSTSKSKTSTSSSSSTSKPKTNK